jgi:hypothetical protein
MGHGSKVLARHGDMDPVCGVEGSGSRVLSCASGSAAARPGAAAVHARKNGRGRTKGRQRSAKARKETIDTDPCTPPQRSSDRSLLATRPRRLVLLSVRDAMALRS